MSSAGQLAISSPSAETPDAPTDGGDLHFESYFQRPRGGTRTSVPRHSDALDIFKRAMSYTRAKPAFQPAGSRILTPGVAVTSTALGYATLLPKTDKLALSTESEARNVAVQQHWEAIRAGTQPPAGAHASRARPRPMTVLRVTRVARVCANAARRCDAPARARAPVQSGRPPPAGRPSRALR